MEIKTLVTKAHENAVKHGFWEPPLPFGTVIALIHSELSEALEEERNGNPDIWFACNESDNFICTPQDEPNVLCTAKKAFASTEAESPKAWPSNWLTRRSGSRTFADTWESTWKK